MRPLYRPMFKYGGPIKEGVMSGIKEPVKKAALVGNSVYPQTGGREHHNVWRTIFGLGAKPTLGPTTKKTLGTEATKGIKSLWEKVFPKDPLSSTLPKSSQDLRGIFVKKTPTTVINPGSTVGPGVGTNRWYWEKGVKPVFGGAGWAVKKALPYATTAGLGGGLIWTGYQWLKPDGTPATKEEVKQHHAAGMGEGKGGDKGGDKPVVLPKTAAQLRKEQIQKYRDIMDIKSMNRDAAYNSLIEASKQVAESEDFKGDIKSGKLINKIIQGASKMYDKPKATKDAIDTLILKGEIEKDLNKDKNALLDAARIKTMAYQDKQMAAMDRAAKEDSLQGDIRNYVNKQGALPAGNMLANFARGRGWNVTAVEDTTEVKKWMKNNEGKDEVDYLTWVTSETEIDPGLYVINNRILQVDENKQIIPRL